MGFKMNLSEKQNAEKGFPFLRSIVPFPGPAHGSYPPFPLAFSMIFISGKNGNGGTVRRPPFFNLPPFHVHPAFSPMVYTARSTVPKTGNSFCLFPPWVFPGEGRISLPRRPVFGKRAVAAAGLLSFGSPSPCKRDSCGKKVVTQNSYGTIGVLFERSGIIKNSYAPLAPFILVASHFPAPFASIPPGGFFRMWFSAIHRQIRFFSDIYTVR